MVPINKRNKRKVPQKKWITNGILISTMHKEHLVLLQKTNPAVMEFKNAHQTYAKILKKVCNLAKHRY